MRRSVFYIIHDQSSVAADDFLLFLIITGYLAEILFHDVDYEVGVIVGKLTDGVEQHARQSVPRILDLESLRVHDSEKVLVNRVEPLNFRRGDFKILYGALHFEPVELHLGCGLHEDLRHGDGFLRILGYRLRELFLRHWTFAACLVS